MEAKDNLIEVNNLQTRKVSGLVKVKLMNVKMSQKI